MDSSALAKVTQSAGCYLNSRRRHKSLHYQHRMRLTGHLMAETKRRISLNISLHPVAKQAKNAKARGYTHDL